MDVANTLRKMKHFALQNEIHWIKSIFIPREHVGKKNCGANYITVDIIKLG